MRQSHYDYVLILFSFLLLEWGFLYFVYQWGTWEVVAGVALTFAALSIAANYFPSVIHGEKKSLNFKSTHISHRGGGGERLENTMSAFENAANLGTDMFELDCQLTSDLKVVVAHDDDLLRICGEEGRISSTNFDDLPPLKTKLPITFLKGWITQHLPVNDTPKETIPLLEDVLTRFPDMPVNIDPKTPRCVAHVAKLIRKHKRERTVAWGCHDDDVITECLASDPDLDIPLIFSQKRFFWILLLHFTGLLPFVHLEESLLEIPMTKLVVGRSGHASLDLPETRLMDLAMLLFDFLVLKCGFIDHLKRRGIRILVWVLNDKQDYQAALDAGFDGIMTDFPHALKEFLQKPGEDVNVRNMLTSVDGKCK